jgi:hypothetical protein
MSFDINEAVFDSEGTYLEEKAVPYEQALMEQFAASRSVTHDYPERNRAGLGPRSDPLWHHLLWRDSRDDDPQRSRRSGLWPLPAQSHHPEWGRGRDSPRITRLLALSPPACTSCRKPGRCWHA